MRIFPHRENYVGLLKSAFEYRFGSTCYMNILTEKNIPAKKDPSWLTALKFITRESTA